MSSHLATLSDEDRQAFLAAAQVARKEKRQAGILYANENLKLDYADEQHWKELGSRHGVRRFQWYEPATVKNMRKAVKKVGRDASWFTDVFGFSRYLEHERANPRMTANAFLGFCLEQIDEEKSSV